MHEAFVGYRHAHSKLLFEPLVVLSESTDELRQTQPSWHLGSRVLKQQSHSVLLNLQEK